MADISIYTEAIAKSTKGEYVRDSIIRALESITFGGNAHTLEGKTADDLVTGKTLQDAIAKVREVVDQINAKAVEGGITTKLNWTEDQKKEIIKAIEDMGVTVPFNTTLEELADRILEIITDFDLDTLEVTENGGYSASSEGMDGFDKVVVNVQPEMTEFTVVENGTYTAKSEGVDGFSKVTVEVPADVPEQGLEGPFDVLFLASDKHTVLQQVKDVPKGGTAVYTGPTPIDSENDELVFVGWSPEPVNVDYNMVCYPVFETEFTAMDVPEMELYGTDDPWYKIAANPENYPIGTIKPLRLKALSGVTDPYGYSGTIDLPEDIVICQKVAEGEDGSGSSWLALYPSGTSYKSNLNTYTTRYLSATLDSVQTKVDWSTCKLRDWLNSVFIYRVAIKSLIKPVKKYTTSIKEGTYYKNGYLYEGYIADLNKETEDSIWIPSVQEIGWFDRNNPPLYAEHTIFETEGLSYGMTSIADSRSIWTTSDYYKYIQFAKNNNISGYIPEGYLTRSVHMNDETYEHEEYSLPFFVIVHNSFSNNDVPSNIRTSYRADYENNQALVFGFCL